MYNISSRFSEYLLTTKTLEDALRRVNTKEYTLLIKTSSNIDSMFENDYSNNAIKWCEKNCNSLFYLYVSSDWYERNPFGLLNSQTIHLNVLYLIFEDKKDAFLFKLSNDNKERYEHKF